MFHLALLLSECQNCLGGFTGRSTWICSLWATGSSSRSSRGDDGQRHRVPDTAKEKPQRGKILAVGPGPRDEDGEYIKMDVEVGDEVIFSKYGGTEIKVGADDVLILRESDIAAKVVGDRAAV